MKQLILPWGADKWFKIFQNLFSTDRLPDIQGYLHMKDGKKSWKRYFFVLRKSGLYYSTKNLSKDPRHLTLFCSLSDVDIYYAQQPKKTLGAPTNFCLVMKPPKAVTDIKDLKCICVDDEASRTSWCTALRIIKVRLHFFDFSSCGSSQINRIKVYLFFIHEWNWLKLSFQHGGMLQENHRAAMRNEDKLRTMESRAAGQGTYIKSRVAMDFTGSDSRVVTDPNEALSVAIEEGSHWIVSTIFLGSLLLRMAAVQCKQCMFTWWFIALIKWLPLSWVEAKLKRRNFV